MSNIYKLIIEDDEGKTTVYPLVGGEISIGRKEGNTIRLTERNVSRRHARLVRSDDEVYLDDLDSYNGVRINGERIAARFRVREGDLIEIGDYHLALQREEASQTTEATQPLDANETHDSEEGEPGWPGGTVPDFRLPEDLLSEAQLPRDLGVQSRSSRETTLDEAEPGQSTSPLAEARAPSEPLVRPPPREPSTLPPFPANGVGATEDVPTPRAAEIRVREPTDGQPTRQLARSPLLRSDFPRLVCVSTQYAGRSYPLDRPELIIGRVEDNDIVVEHRSVSRNHAKIRFDGRTHRIIDLQSANGILVNGEEYAMTNLRAGDLIELGNVRFRFVPAGDAFEATDEEAREMRANGIEPPTVDGQTHRSEAPGSTEHLLGSLDAGPLVGEDPEIAPGDQTFRMRTDILRAESGAFPAPVVGGEASATDGRSGYRARERLEDRSSTAPYGQGPYDPSTAATITDAPRSVLPPGSPAVVSNPNGASDRASLGATRPDERATTQRNVPPRDTSKMATTVIGPSNLPPTGASDEDSFDPSVHLRNRRVMQVLIAILAVIVAVLLFFVLGRGDETQDRKLEELYNQGDYLGVKAHYSKHEGDFAHPVKAAILLGRAEERLARPEMDATGLRAPVEARPEGLADEPSTEGLASSPRLPEAPPSAPPSERSRKRRTSSPSKRVIRLYRLGRDALIVGDLQRAERFLIDCVRRASDYAPCHRSLGILFAQRQDNARAIRHYRRYIELSPDAVDAEQVRDNIRAFESGGAP